MRRIGLGLVGSIPVREVIPLAQEAEALGYESLWIHETYYQRDAQSFLSALAVTTQRIGLATGSISPYTRHPVQLALTFAALDEASTGRAIIGLGAGYMGRLDQMGIPHASPVGRMRESAKIIRAVLRGEEVNLEGKEFKIKGVKAMFKPLRSNIPLYLAGWGPKMLALAAECYEGHLGRPAESLQSLQRITSELNRLAASSDRSIELDLAGYVFTLVADDKATACALARKNPFFVYMMAVLDDQVVVESGFDPAIKAAIAQAYWQGDITTAGAHIPDHMIDALAAIGNQNDVMAKLEAMTAVGLKLPVLQPILMDTASIQRIVAVGGTYANLRELV